jgi:hypothetical protein
MAYWWESDTEQRYWVEIRKVPGTGIELWSPTHDKDGGSDPWYDLVGSIIANQVIYHWNAREHRFVGRSEADSDAYIDTTNNSYRVPLRGFQPLTADISLATVRGLANELYRIRDELRSQYGDPLYLPFQFTADRSSFRFMSNYFAKLPQQMVSALFGSDGLGNDSAPSAPPDSDVGDSHPYGTTPPSTTSTTRAFLQPFRPKADTSYLANVIGGRATRDRHHEALVNSCAGWLATWGLTPGCNAAVDLGIPDRRVIIEAKTVQHSWAATIREAVGQLYEYRFFKVADPSWRLILLADRPIPSEWVKYLERDRKIGAMWPAAGGFYLSRLAGKALG